MRTCRFVVVCVALLVGCSAYARYIQADPLGPAAGPNPYVYVFANPLALTDPTGLDVDVCYYEDAAHGFGHVGFRVTGETQTFGFYPIDGALEGPGTVKEDRQHEQQCKVIEAPREKDQCMLQCRAKRAANPGTYRLFSRQCTSFVRDCLAECGLPRGKDTGSRPWPFFKDLPGRAMSTVR